MELSKQLQDKIEKFMSHRPIVKAYLFGSFARGEADTNSDIDLLVELDPYDNPGIDFFSYKPELEKLLGKKVDITVQGGLSKYIEPHIDVEKKIIYERPKS